MDIETQDLKDLIAKDKIRAVIYRLARGLDRCDKALLQSCFHPGATDDHGLFKGTAEEFCDWVVVELKKFERTQHFICNINMELSGDKAATESYFIAHHVLDMPGENGALKKTDMVAAGRYLDSFAHKDGEWRMMHRHAVYDWNHTTLNTSQWEDGPVKEILARGVQGSEDLSYAHLKSV